MDLQDLTPTQDAAQMLGLSGTRVRQLIQTGVLDSYKWGGRHFVTSHSLETWIRGRGRRSWKPKNLRELALAKGEILELAAQHAVGNVRVLGSIKDGSADQYSDVDLLISLAPGSTVMNAAAFGADVEDAVNRPVQVFIDRGESAVLTSMREAAVAL